MEVSSLIPRAQVLVKIPEDNPLRVLDARLSISVALCLEAEGGSRAPAPENRDKASPP